MPLEFIRYAGSRTIIRALCPVLVAVLATAGCAATYHVDGARPASTDTNSGTHAAPFKTIAAGAARLGPGDTLIVAPGVYDEVVTVAVSGTEKDPITLKSAEPRKARVKGFVLQGDYISIDGFEIANDAKNANGIFAGQAHYKNARTGCRFVNNYLHDLTGTAITAGVKALVKDNLMRRVYRGVYANSGTLVEDNEVDTLVPVMVTKNGKTKPKKTQYTFFAGDDITFRGNYLHGAPEKYLTQGMGVCFFASWDAWIFGSSHRILIENNRCFNATHASEPTATVKKKSSHITYRNNLFVNTAYVGVMPKQFSHVTVENNTFINCGAYPVWLQGERQCTTSVVRNNLIAYWKRDRAVKEFDWKPAESGIRIDFEGAKDFCDNNMFFGCLNRKYGKRDFVAEPQFVDPDKGDFRLKPGSPGVDAGMTLPVIKTDLRGVKRPQGKAHDVGA